MFQNAVGDALAQKTIDAITQEMDANYPQMAPWENIVWEQDEKGGLIHRNYLQIVKDNTCQPAHFDGGPIWFADEHGNLWSPMSTITNLHDGVGTYVHGDPVFGVFETALKKKDDTAAGLHVLSHLRKCEQTVGSVFHGPDNHAGQILAFHPGEQVHRGMG